jgi:hypothetical protein
VKDFECGGISAAEFCRRRGMSSVSLAQWRRRYSGNAHSPTAVPSWLPVVIAGAGPPKADASVVYVMIAGQGCPVPGGGGAHCSGTAQGVLRGAGFKRAARMHGILPHMLSMNGIHDSGVPLRSRKSLNSL